MFNKLKFLLIFFSISLSAQPDNCLEKTKEVYTNILEAIGNKFPPPPKFKIEDSENKIAFANGREIVIEKKLIESLCLQENFEDKISYILAHELAHHFLNHTWMYRTGFSYSSSIGEFINNAASTKDQRKISETQADLYAGFFGQIAGYNTLKHAKNTLNYVYELYSIPNEISGYPSLDERKQIIETNVKAAEALVLIFEIGNALLQLKEFSVAEAFFQEILNRNFNSREIYNNLGLVYLLKAINSDERFSKFNYPVHLELNTRLENEKTRSIVSENFEKLIELSEKNLKTALSLDPDYINAKKNLITLNFIKLKAEGVKKALSNKRLTEIPKENRTDFQVLDMLLDGEPINKIKKVAKKTKSNTTQLNLSLKKVKTKDDWDIALKSFKIDEFDLLYNNEKSKTIRSGEIDIDIYEKNEDVFYSIHMLNVFSFQMLKTKQPIGQFDLNSIKLKGYNYIVRK